MSFLEQTIVKKFLTEGKTFSLLLTEQECGNWVATVLWIINSSAKTHHEPKMTKADSYKAAVAWILHNIDANASVEPL